MSGWTDEDYRRLGMTPPRRADQITLPTSGAPTPVAAVPVQRQPMRGSNDMLGLRSALARRLKDAGE